VLADFISLCLVSFFCSRSFQLTFMSRRGRPERTGVSLHVSGFNPHKVRKEDLRPLFEEHGSVLDVHIPVDYHTR
jgi:RNA recognition motif-containing protein